MVLLAGILAVAVGAFGYRWLHDRFHTPSTGAAPLPAASRTPPPRTEAPSSAAPVDLRALDWASFAIPGSLCRSAKPIRLHDGTAINVPSDFDGPEENMAQDVRASTDKIVYGDVTGDGHDEAALPVLCANHDSTAAGQTAMGIMIFDGSSGQAALLATLTSQQPRVGEPPNFLAVTEMGAGKVAAVDTYYRQDDPNCCPSGNATETWSYRNGTLTPDPPAAG